MPVKINDMPENNQSERTHKEQLLKRAGAVGLDGNATPQDVLKAEKSDRTAKAGGRKKIGFKKGIYKPNENVHPESKKWRKGDDTLLMQKAKKKEQ